MNKGNIFIIGDIHGCLNMLKRLIDKILWQPHQDRLIFLGDYIDRGEDSKGVVNFLLKLADISPQVDFLMGNHEMMFLDYLANRNRSRFVVNGGDRTIKSYRKNNPDNEEEVPENHLRFFQGLRLFLELDDFYIVHAGFKPNVSITKQTHLDMLWIRDPFIYSKYNFGKKVIYGHTPFKEPYIMNNKIGIDTGAVYGNKLTCLEITEMRFHFVEATR